MISASEEFRYIRKSIDIGASGFIPKSASTDIMLSAIKLVKQGGGYIQARIVKYSSEKTTVSKKQFSTITANELVSKLTGRQTEVLKLMSDGMTNKEIARTLMLSGHTVKVHVTAVLKTLNASNRTEAVVMAKNSGVIDDYQMG